MKLNKIYPLFFVILKESKQLRFLQNDKNLLNFFFDEFTSL